jgi:hypothetical protein
VAGTRRVRRAPGAFELDEVIALSPGIDDDRQRTAFALALSTQALGKTIDTEPGLTPEFGE